VYDKEGTCVEPEAGCTCASTRHVTLETQMRGTVTLTLAKDTVAGDGMGDIHTIIVAFKTDITG